jgi:hypothetical protein
MANRGMSEAQREAADRASRETVERLHQQLADTSPTWTTVTPGNAGWGWLPAYRVVNTSPLSARVDGGTPWSVVAAPNWSSTLGRRCGGGR